MVHQTREPRPGRTDTPRRATQAIGGAIALVLGLVAWPAAAFQDPGHTGGPPMMSAPGAGPRPGMTPPPPIPRPMPSKVAPVMPAIANEGGSASATAADRSGAPAQTGEPPRKGAAARHRHKSAAVGKGRAKAAPAKAAAAAPR